MKRQISSLLLKHALAFDKMRLCAREGDTYKQSALFKRITAVLLAFVFIVSCSPSVNPQILTFNYTLRTNVDPLPLVDSVQNGLVTISDLLGPDSCNFTADFSTSTPPVINTSGSPGQMGFNVNIATALPANLATTNPSSCDPISSIDITIGGRSEMLGLGTQTARTEGKITLSGGRRFETTNFFQARVLTFDTATRRTSGDFRFISGLLTDSHTVLIVEGSYALTP